jgi:hypothetical protein
MRLNTHGPKYDSHTHHKTVLDSRRTSLSGTLRFPTISNRFDMRCMPFRDCLPERYC